MKSMTGYGEAQGTIDGRNIDSIVKSVNHKYFVFSPHLPESLKPFETEFEHLARKFVSRGRVELDLQLNVPEQEEETPVDLDKAQSYLNALNKLKEEFGLAGEINVRMVANGPGVIPEEQFGNREWVREYLEEMKEVVADSLEQLDKNRKREGDELKTALEREMEVFDEGVSKIQDLVPEMVENYREKLTKKLGEMSLDDMNDEDRELLNKELRIYIDKVDITEELDRLTAHVDQFMDTLDENGSIGRKLDFIAQELLREINTVAAKSKHSEIGAIVVNLKSALGSIREQTKNIE